jgi:ABC-type transport system involved in cytochrome bd biosynthesis fused ATPase/permease subunit
LVSSLHLKNLLHRKLLFRLIIPLITAAMMLVVIIIDSFFTSFPAITFAWVLVGIVIGFPFGRLTKISWNSDKT